MADEQDRLAKLTAGVVAAYVGAHDVAVDDLPGLIASVYGALSRAGSPNAAPAGTQPATKLTAAQMLGLQVGVAFQHFPIPVPRDQGDLFDCQARFEETAGALMSRVVEDQSVVLFAHERRRVHVLSC